MNQHYVSDLASFTVHLVFHLPSRILKVVYVETGGNWLPWPQPDPELPYYALDDSEGKWGKTESKGKPGQFKWNDYYFKECQKLPQRRGFLGLSERIVKIASSFGSTLYCSWNVVSHGIVITPSGQITVINECFQILCSCSRVSPVYVKPYGIFRKEAMPQESGPYCLKTSAQTH